MNIRLAGPNLELWVAVRAALAKPSCLQTTSASLRSHSSSQTLPQLPLWKISTLPASSKTKKVEEQFFISCSTHYANTIHTVLFGARALKPIK